MTVHMERDLEFIYVGDPMCSWCWGFAPVLERMQEVYEIPIRVVVGGLRPGPDAEELDDRVAATLAHHWEQVAHASGQPFDHSFLDRRDGWIYDTETPAVAVVAMRELSLSDTLRFHTRLQRAFYSERVDIVDPAEYPALLDGFEPEPELTAEGALDALERASAEVIDAEAAADADFARVIASQRAFSADYDVWRRFAYIRREAEPEP